MEELKKKGWYLNENGFKCCLEALGFQNSCPSVNDIIKVALNLDLHHIGDKALPENINSGQCTLLSGPIVLQLQKQCNISAPTISQESSTAPRMIKFYLTDGKLNCIALEYSNLVDLKTDTLVPGTKLCLMGSNINIVNGAILLENNQLVFLGGEVEKLKEKWILMKKAHLLNRKMNGSGPPPFQEFDPAKFKNKFNVVQDINVKNRENETKLKDSGGEIKLAESCVKAASNVSSLVHSKQSKKTSKNKDKFQYQEKFDKISVENLPVGNIKKEKIAVQVQQNEPESHAISKKDMVNNHHLQAESRNRCNKEEDNFNMPKNLQSQNSRDLLKSYEHKSGFVCYDAKNDKWTREDNSKCDTNMPREEYEKENKSITFLDKKSLTDTNFHSNSKLGEYKKDKQLSDNRKNTKPRGNGKTTQSRDNEKDARPWDNGKGTQFIGTRAWSDVNDSFTYNYRQETQATDTKHWNDRKNSLTNNSGPSTQSRDTRNHFETNTYRKDTQKRDDKRKELNNRKTTQLRVSRKDSPLMNEERSEFQLNPYRKYTKPKYDKRYESDERKYSQLSDNRIDTDYRNAMQLKEERNENLSREEKRNIHLNSFRQELQPEVSKNPSQLNAHKKSLEIESYTQINGAKKNMENEKTLRDARKNSPSREKGKGLFKPSSCKRDTQLNDSRDCFQSHTHVNTQPRNKQTSGSWKDTDFRKVKQIIDEKKENLPKDENRKDFQPIDNRRPNDYRRGTSMRNERDGYQSKFDEKKDFKERNY